jgi:hypothetical protein
MNPRPPLGVFNLGTIVKCSGAGSTRAVGILPRPRESTLCPKRRNDMAKAPETPASEPAFDLRKLMGEFDPNKLIGQFQSMLTQYKLPSVDIDKLIAAQQKNLEAVAEANRAAVRRSPSAKSKCSRRP